MKVLILEPVDQEILNQEIREGRDSGGGAGKGLQKYNFEIYLKLI